MRVFSSSNPPVLLLLVLLYSVLTVQVALCSSSPTQLPGIINREYEQLARDYNKIVGTHQIDPRYQFVPNEHYLYEGAQRMLAAGFTCLTFSFQPQYANQSKVDLNQNPMTLVEIATNPAFSIEAVFDLPFSTFFMWIDPRGDYYNDSLYQQGKQQMSDFTEYLMSRYQGTGKTFMLGTWKGDSLLRYWVPWPGAPNASTPYNPHAMKYFPRKLQAHAAGVDEARARLSEVYKGVQVYSYFEVNFMKSETINYTVIDDIVPTMDPAPDYIAVSVTTMPEYVRDLNPAEKMYPMLDHVRVMLPQKVGIPEPRVFVGEFEFPRLDIEGNPDPYTPTQELQAQHALVVAAASLSWGSPYASLWTLYDNTRTIWDYNTGNYQDRGFGLVTRDNQTTVLFDALMEYMTDAKEWLYQQIQDHDGVVPCFNDFRLWAASKLITLAKDIGGPEAAAINLPQFIPRDC